MSLYLALLPPQQQHLCRDRACPSAERFRIRPQQGPHPPWGRA